MITGISQALDFSDSYDAHLLQCGGDMNIYLRMVCDTICVTVPKAIVHCMVSLYTAVCICVCCAGVT